jgi:hypothetical protein
MVVPAFTVAGGIRGAMSKNRLPSIKVMMRGKGHRKGGAHSGSLRILNSPRVMTNMIKVVGYEDRETIKLTEGSGLLLILIESTYRLLPLEGHR